MRLLKFGHDGALSMTEFTGNNIPDYAILSHTWETPSSQEITFEELRNGVDTNKPGYKKIEFCGHQAKKDDLEYFWIDSCCIDKSSSSELTESLNSMFRWYQNAVKCYVYLSDVSISELDEHTQTQYPFGTPSKPSKWFTRGWTLQELLAPRSVKFFTRECTYLGDRESFKFHIHEITAIAISALQGSPMSKFTIEERLSWAAKRETTRDE